MARGVRIQDWETPEALDRLRAVSALTMEQIARDVIGINKTTLYRWCARSESISQALQQKVDEETRRKVEAELIKSCFDRKMKVKTKKQTLDREGNVHDLVEEREIALPADFRALAYVLNNRAPGRWSQKPVAESGEGQLPIGFIPVFDRIEPDEGGTNADE
jgi:AcrR family transcriptional regulator